MAITTSAKFSPRNNGKYSDILSLGKWKKGIVNLVDSYSMDNESLVDALNVDFYDDGKIKSRSLYKKVISANIGSLYPFRNYLYCVKEGVFGRYDKSLNFTTLYPLNSFNKAYYTEVNNELYVSNGSNSLKINQSENTEEWSIDSPSAPPGATYTAGDGNLRSGRYIIRYTYNFGNYETGASKHVLLDLPAGRNDYSIEVYCPQGGLSTGANIYLSTGNGEDVYLVAKAYYAKVQNEPNGKALPTEYHLKYKFPALEQICFQNGRIYGVEDNAMYFTNPFDYRQMSAKNMRHFDSNIVIFVPVAKGFYIVTENKTYFLNGANPEKGNLEIKFDFSAIKGTLIKNNKDMTVGWLSRDGYIVGDQDGNLKNMTEETLDFPKEYVSGTALIKKKDTIEQVIFSLQEKGTSSTLSSEGFREEFDNES